MAYYPKSPPAEVPATDSYEQQAGGPDANLSKQLANLSLGSSTSVCGPGTNVNIASQVRHFLSPQVYQSHHLISAVRPELPV